MAWAVSLVLAAALSPFCRARTAGAQEGEARAQLDAQTVIAQGRYKEACPALEESWYGTADPLVRWSLPACWEKAGRAARAWGLYRELAALPQSSAEDRQVARARAAALEPRLARLAIHVSEPALAGLRVNIDGEPLPSRRWGSELRLDVGRHRLDARAPGHRAWEHVIQANAGGPPTRVDIPRLELGAGDDTLESASPSTSVSPMDGSGEPARPTGPDYTAAYIAGGIGVAGLAVGGIAWRLAASKSAESRQSCAGQTEGCTPAPKDDREAARRYARAAHRVSQIGLGVGALALIAGGVLYFVTKDEEAEPANRVRVAPSIGMDELGISVSGAF